MCAACVYATVLSGVCVRVCVGRGRGTAGLVGPVSVYCDWVRQKA